MNADLNRCGALEEFECVWTFDHPDSHGRTGHWEEKGWQVYHFFPEPDKYTVKASFQLKDGTVVAGEAKPGEAKLGEAKLPITVEKNVEVGDDNTTWFGDRTRIETVRFAIVLFATVLGLVGGAREQLMKLDVLPGLVAVCLIGFGADAVKNMLLDRGT